MAEREIQIQGQETMNIRAKLEQYQENTKGFYDSNRALFDLASQLNSGT